MSRPAKKIILDCDLMRHPHSGLYHYCLNLGLEINKLLEKDGDATLSFFVPPAEKNSFGSNAKTIVERKDLRNFLKSYLWDCDIWHAPFQSGRIIPRRMFKKSPRILLTIHDLNPLHEGQPVEEQKKSIRHTQALIDKADAIVCISQFSRDDVLRNCDIGNKPVYVIHNGTHKISEPGFQPQAYQPIRPFLFGMGYVNRKKNYHALLPLLKDESIELVIAGRLDEPEYISGMVNQADLLGVSDRLKLLGPVSEEDKAWYFNNCSAFVHPSLAEGFGAPVVEAMQFGKPIFLSNLTSLPEIAGDVAFYFKTFESDHMQQVFREGMKYYAGNGLADRILQRGRYFNWQEKAKQYLAVYRTLYQ
jgi:glycosyltransferase involved in cell wall biosynthesis